MNNKNLGPQSNVVLVFGILLSNLVLLGGCATRMVRITHSDGSTAVHKLPRGVTTEQYAIDVVAANKPCTNPVTAKDYYQRGLYYQEKIQPDQAIPEYTQAIALEPDYADAYAQRGLCRLVTDSDAALADLSKAIKLRPKQPRYYRRRALVHSQAKHVDLALADYDMAIALDRNESSLYLEKANLLFSDKRFREAILVYRAFLKKTPSLAGRMVVAFLTGGILGILLDPLGQLREARDVAPLRESVSKMIELCETMLHETSSAEIARDIIAGMPKLEVLKMLLATETVVAGGWP